MTQTTTVMSTFLTPADFLTYWLSHRHLTRRVIEAFPEDQLFTFTAAPPMRPFAEMAWEIHGVTAYTLNGLVTGDWGEPVWDAQPAQTREALLAAWDELSRRIEAELPGVSPTRYAEEQPLAWGPMTGWFAAIGVVDNEIHHRGQGYVYLRALGITPPDFWAR
ncbi:DinB family protein [Deinococcus apachensis]|uniref:DinB family protein n=1 Tax=Deinococcus apachensis TaxID=309886 RepID=UPI0003710F84|nr:DinB family protein [Deinococcus apachensis]